MKNKIKVLVIGSGFAAKLLHLPVWKGFDDAEIVGICDIDKKSAINAAQIFGVKNTYDTLEAGLCKETPDLIDICTPPRMHASLSKQAIEAGIPCMIEKPFTTTTSEADELIGLSEKKNVKLFVLHTYSYLPCFRKAKKMFDEGAIGELVSVNTNYLVNFGSERYVQSNHWAHNLPAGILFSEITPHLLMLLLDYIGVPETVECKAYKLSTIPYVNADELHAVLKSSNHLAQVGLSYNSPIANHNLCIVGTTGIIEAESCTQTVVLHKQAKTSSGPVYRAKWFFSESLQRFTNFSSVSINTAIGRYRVSSEGHRFLMRKCISNLLGDGDYPVELAKSREVVRLLNLIGDTVVKTD
jgi:predicted dehydrogenase